MRSEETVERIVAFIRQAEDIELDADAIGEGLHVRRMHRELVSAVEAVVAQADLSARQMDILEILYFHADAIVTPAELAEEIALTRSAVTAALDSLQRAGHICRSPHPDDRRMVGISLTPAGRRFVARRLPERYRMMGEVIRVLTPRERRMLISVYTRILDALKRLPRGTPQ